MKLEFKRRIVEIVLSADCRLTAYSELEKYFEKEQLIEKHNKTEEFVDELIYDLKLCIKHAENMKKVLNIKTQPRLHIEQIGKIDGLKLAILQVIQIAKENQIKTKYDGQENGTML